MSSTTSTSISENTSFVNGEKNKIKTAEKPLVKGVAFYFKLMLLYLLNISDWLCTMALISSGKFYEANPIMQPVFENFWLTLLIKGAVPLVLVILCAVLYKVWGMEETVTMKVILYIGIIVYSLLNLWHIANFVLLFSSF